MYADGNDESGGKKRQKKTFASFQELRAFMAAQKEKR